MPKITKISYPKYEIRNSTKLQGNKETNFHFQKSLRPYGGQIQIFK